MRENRLHAGWSAFAVALVSAHCVAGSPRVGVSTEEPLVQNSVAFHVIGLMKTKSGAT